MAENLIFQYQPGISIMHRCDIRVKLAGMIGISLLLIHVNLFRLLFLLPCLLLLQLASRKNHEFQSIPLLLFLMPIIIFTGNFLSLLMNETELIQAFLTGTLRTLRFIYILWIAHLFMVSTDPMSITGAFYQILKPIPFIPAGRISTQLGLSLSLIPLILDEMKEIRDAMTSRCGWNTRRPLHNLINMGLPLLSGILVKAESLSDAMESRLFSDEATEPETLSNSQTLIPFLILSLTLILLFTSEHLLQTNLKFGTILRFY